MNFSLRFLPPPSPIVDNRSRPSLPLVDKRRMQRAEFSSKQNKHQPPCFLLIPPVPRRRQCVVSKYACPRLPNSIPSHSPVMKMSLNADDVDDASRNKNIRERETKRRRMNLVGHPSSPLHGGCSPIRSMPFLLSPCVC